MTTVAKFVAEMGLDEAPLASGLRRSGALLDKFGAESAAKLSALGSKLMATQLVPGASAGASAAAAFMGAVQSRFDRDVAAAREKMFNGLSSPAEFRQAGERAARAYNEGITRGVKTLGARGLLSDDVRAELVASYKDAGLQAGGALTNSVARAGAAMTSAGRAMTIGVTLPVALAGAAVLNLAGDFEQSMNRLRITTHAGAADIERLTKVARRMGAETKFSAADAAAAMSVLATQGFSVNEILSAIPGTLQLAAAESLGMAEAAKIAASMLRVFGFATSDLTHVNNVLVKVATTTGITLQELAMSMRYSGGFARATGVRFEELSAAMGTLAKNGIRGEQAGTALRAIIGSLVAPTKRSAEVMRELGLNAAVSGGKIQSLAAVVTILQNRQANATQIAEIFGRESASAISALVREGGPALLALTSQMTHVGNVAEEVAGVQMRGWRGALEMVKSSAEEVLISIAETGLLGGMTRLARGFADALAWISRLPSGLLAVVTSVLAVAAAVGPLLLVLGALAKAFVAVRLASLMFAGASGIAKVGAVLAAGAPVLVGLALAAAAVYAVWRAMHAGRAETDDYAAAVEKLSDAQLALARSSLEAARANAAAHVAKLKAAATGPQFFTPMGPGGRATENPAYAALRAQEGALRSIDAMLAQVTTRQGEHAQRAAESAAEMGRVRAEMETMMRGLAGEAGGGAGESMKDLAARVQLVAQAMERVRDRGERIAGVGAAWDSAMRDVLAALVRAGNGVDATSEKLRDMLDLLAKSAEISAALADNLAAGPGKILGGGLNVTPIPIRAPAATPAPMRQGPTVAERAAAATPAPILRMFEGVASGVAAAFKGAIGPVAMLGAVLEPVIPVLSILLEPLRLFGEILARAIMPVMRVLFPVVKIATIALTYLGEIIARVTAGIATAIGSLLKGIGKLLNKLPGSIGDPLIRAGKSMLDFAQAQYTAADQLKRGREELRNLSFDEAAANVNKLGEAAGAAADAVRNLPDWYKLESAIFAATAPERVAASFSAMPSAAATAAPMATAIASPAAAGGAPSVGTSAGVIVNGGIHVTNEGAAATDVRQQVRNMIAELRRAASLQLGSPERWPEIA